MHLCVCGIKPIGYKFWIREKAYWEKARRELQKNVTSYIEQILKATLHETAAVRPPTSNL